MAASWGIKYRNAVPLVGEFGPTMVAFFRSRKSAAPPPPEEEDYGPSPGGLAARLNYKEIELYPTAIKILWHYYDPADVGHPEGREREFPGPLDENVSDSIRELEKMNLIEVVPTFTDFSVTAKLTKLGLDLMSKQSAPGTLTPVEITDPSTGATTGFKA
ncbi:MAG TPA: hypothetical protein VEY07_00415, partial [Thermoplasmata archaeon]|nr:hypothetical protein [Thermoplasmata archaeon]